MRNFPIRSRGNYSSFYPTFHGSGQTPSRQELPIIRHYNRRQKHRDWRIQKPTTVQPAPDDPR